MSPGGNDAGISYGGIWGVYRRHGWISERLKLLINIIIYPIYQCMKNISNEDWHSAQLLNLSGTDDSSRLARRKLITLFKKAGIRDYDKLARNIIFNFNQIIQQTWYYPTHGLRSDEYFFKPLPKSYVRAFRAMEQAGLVKRYKTESNKHADRYRFTDKFLTWTDTAEVKLSFKPYATVNGDKMPADYHRHPFFNVHKNAMKGWSIVTSNQIIPKIDYHIDLTTAGRNGRLFANYQNLKKHERSTLKFKRGAEIESAVEIDINSCHIRILWSMAGYSEPPMDDLYKVDVKSLYLNADEQRSLTKRCMLRLLNTGNRHLAESSLRGFSADETVRNEARHIIRLLADRGNLDFNLASLMYNFIIADILDQLTELHKPIADLISSHNSSSLMWMESDILIRWVSKLSEANIPVLPLHDAVMIPESAGDFAIEALKDVWIDYFRFDRPSTPQPLLLTLVSRKITKLAS